MIRGQIDVGTGLKRRVFQQVWVMDFTAPRHCARRPSTLPRTCSLPQMSAHNIHINLLKVSSDPGEGMRGQDTADSICSFRAWTQPPPPTRSALAFTVMCTVGDHINQDLSFLVQVFSLSQFKCVQPQWGAISKSPAQWQMRDFTQGYVFFSSFVVDKLKHLETIQNPWWWNFQSENQ